MFIHEILIINQINQINQISLDPSLSTRSDSSDPAFE